MDIKKIKSGLLIVSWALYDLGAEFFMLNVVSLYFVRWLTLEKHGPEILYSLSFGISTFLVGISAPVLGAASDLSRRRMPFLIYFTLIAVVFTMLLAFPKGIFLGLLFFGIANYGSKVAAIFYNTLLADIAPRNKVGLISGIGRMTAYTAAILALYLIKPIVLKSGYQATFIPTGWLFLGLTLPCMLFIKDKGKGRMDLHHFLRKEKISGVFRTLKETVFTAGEYPGLLDFLKAAFWSLCGVNAIILFMSIYATRVFGMDESAVMKLFGFSTFFAILGSIFFGFVSDRIGYKRCLKFVLLLWIICFSWGSLARNDFSYWSIGALVGISLGGIWGVSRALAVKIFPAQRMGELFGLFNLVGYLAAVVGPLFWGLCIWFLSGWGELGYRITVLAMTQFIVLGFIFLRRLPDIYR